MGVMWAWNDRKPLGISALFRPYARTETPHRRSRFFRMLLIGAFTYRCRSSLRELGEKDAPYPGPYLGEVGFCLTSIYANDFNLQGVRGR